MYALYEDLKCVMIQESRCGNISKDKVFLGKKYDNEVCSYINSNIEDEIYLAIYDITLAILRVSSDLDTQTEYPMCASYQSIQIRPKSLYHNSTGYYIKENGKQVYITNEDELAHIEHSIKKYTKYLEEGRYYTIPENLKRKDSCTDMAALCIITDYITKYGEDAALKVFGKPAMISYQIETGGRYNGRIR
jgi:hypothetical protein